MESFKRSGDEYIKSVFLTDAEKTEKKPLKTDIIHGTPVKFRTFPLVEVKSSGLIMDSMTPEYDIVPQSPEMVKRPNQLNSSPLSHLEVKKSTRYTNSKLNVNPPVTEMTRITDFQGSKMGYVYDRENKAIGGYYIENKRQIEFKSNYLDGRYEKRGGDYY